MIIQLVGTSGAGKTTIAKEVMTRYGRSNGVMSLGEKRPEAYKVIPPTGGRPLFVLGSYENTCGGVDTIGSSAELLSLIEKYVDQGHVLFEGLLISTYYGSLGVGLEKYLPGVVRCFINVDIEVCIRRVLKRRAEAGNKRPFNESNTRGRLKAIASFKSRLHQRGQRVETITSADDVMRILHEHS